MTLLRHRIYYIHVYLELSTLVGQIEVYHVAMIDIAVIITA